MTRHINPVSYDDEPGPVNYGLTTHQRPATSPVAASPVVGGVIAHSDDADDAEPHTDGTTPDDAPADDTSPNAPTVGPGKKSGTAVGKP